MPMRAEDFAHIREFLRGLDFDEPAVTAMLQISEISETSRLMQGSMLLIAMAYYHYPAGGEQAADGEQ